MKQKIDRFIRMNEVIQLTGLSRSTIYRLEKGGVFPKKVKISARAIAYLESQIAEFMNSRPAVQGVHL